MNKRIWVTGSANIDVVISLGAVPHAGETVFIDGIKHIPGGKGANRAVALQRLCAQPVFCCCIGNDEYGNALLNTYKSENMETSHISFADNCSTGTAYIFVEKNGANRIAVYPGANTCFADEKVKTVIDNMSNISLISAECEIPLSSVEELIFAANKSNVPIIIDTAPISAEMEIKCFKGAYLISPNESEAKALTGIDIIDTESAKEACVALFAAGVNYSLIKLGSHGSICYNGREFFECSAFSGAGKVADTTAAGDCYMAALCREISAGKSVESAMRFATVAAGIAVTRHGAIPSMPQLHEVEKFI